jgi:uncharacterized 2Fe-2S/4Fe-4S cluster protein (DUF4445 family)
MRIKTYKKRRKIKSKEEYIIKKLMDKCKVSKRDIHKVIFEKNGVKYKFYICTNKTKLIFYPSFQPLKPYFSVKEPFGELEHPSIVINEN